MERSLQRIEQFASRWGWLGPLIAFGLYIGRVLSEIVQPGLFGAVIMTAGATGLSVLILRRQTLDKTWPLLFLLLYVVYPEADTSAALTVAALTLTIAALNCSRRWKRASSWRGRLPMIAAVLVGIGFFVLYLATLAPGLLPADSGEFQLVGATFGVAHPPGFPLYTILANLLSHLPSGQSPATMVNAFSAILGAITVVLVYGSVYRLTHSMLGGLVAALALGTATTFWSQSTTANIRVFTAFFGALAIYLLVRFREEKQREDDSPNGVSDEGDSSSIMSSRRFWLLLGFVFVLTLGVTHHTSLIFMGLIFVVYLLAVDRKWIRETRVWPWLILVVVLGLLPLLYLPLRAAAGAQGAPADLTTLKGFLNHILALGFRGDFFYFTDPAVFWERLKVMANIMTFQFNTLLLIVMGVGFIFLLWRDRKLAFLLGGSVAIMVVITALYRAPQSVEYLMPAYVTMAIILGIIVGAGANRLRSTKEEDAGPGAAIAVLLGIIILAAVAQGFERYSSFAYLHEVDRTREFTTNMLEETPGGSVILADWHWVTPLLYQQEVESMRPDVEVEFVYPTSEDYGQTWARRIQEELDAGNAVLATHFDQEFYAPLPSSDPIGDAFLFGGEPSLELPIGFSPADIRLDDIIEIVGSKVEGSEAEIGREALLTLAWRPLNESGQDLTLFVHLVGADGKIYAQQDVPARPKEEGLTFTQFRLTSRPGSQPVEYGLLVGAYGLEPLADELGETRIPIGSLTLLPASMPSVSFNPVNLENSIQDDERTLVGFDWDNTLPHDPRLYLHWMNDDGYHSETIDSTEGVFELDSYVGPWGVERKGRELRNDGTQRYIPFGQGIVWSGKTYHDDDPQPGQELSLPQFFNSSRPIDRDLVVSARLVGFEDDGFHWDWWDLDDSIPAMGAIPTLKWIRGSSIRDPHWLNVDEVAWPGQVVRPLLRLYDSFTGRELPLLDERISQQTPWLPTGTGIIAE
jgi:hypothetical protein